MKESRLKTELMPGTEGEYFYMDTGQGGFPVQLWYRTGGNREQHLIGLFPDCGSVERICRIMNKGAI